MKFLRRAILFLSLPAIAAFGVLGTNLEANAARLIIEFKRESDMVFMLGVPAVFLLLVLSFSFSRWSESREAAMNRKKADQLVESYAPTRTNKWLEKYNRQR